MWRESGPFHENGEEHATRSALDHKAPCLMGLYRRFVYPRLVDGAMSQKDAAEVRGRIIPAARGAVLEIGVGSARNLPFYTDAVTHFVAVDSSRELLRIARASRRCARDTSPGRGR